jgi:hypothetical protein
MPRIACFLRFFQKLPGCADADSFLTLGSSDRIMTHTTHTATPQYGNPGFPVFVPFSSLYSGVYSGNDNTEIGNIRRPLSATKSRLDTFTTLLPLYQRCQVKSDGNLFLWQITKCCTDSHSWVMPYEKGWGEVCHMTSHLILQASLHLLQMHGGCSCIL